MADSAPNQPAEHEAQPQPSEGEPTVAQPEKTDDKAKAQAAESKSGGSKSDWRHTLITAAISALAALLGAAVGGFFTYWGSHSQSIAQADAALIERKQSVYADYITAEVARSSTEHLLTDYLSERPIPVDQVNKTADTRNDLIDKCARTGYILRFNASDAVENIRMTIDQDETDIGEIIDKLLGQDSNPDGITDKRAFDDLYGKLDAVRHKYYIFADAARADIKAPNRGLFS
jgi:hypothetical protein